MRFVVPVPAAFARPNRKYFGSKHGMTWLNAMNDRGMGRGAKVVSGPVRDSLHMVDVIFGLDGGDLPEIVVSDSAPTRICCSGGWNCSASRPAQRLRPGPGRPAKICRNWEDILRVIAPIYTGTVRGGGHRTPIGRPVASPGREGDGGAGCPGGHRVGVHPR